MIKIEFSKLKQVISMTQNFYVEAYWTLYGTIFVSIYMLRIWPGLWIYLASK